MLRALPEGWHLTAKALNGHLLRASLTQHARIEFRTSGRPALLHFIPGMLDARTAVRIDVRGLSPGYLTLASSGRPGNSAPNADFDLVYRSDAMPWTLRDRLLTPECKRRLMKVLAPLHRTGRNRVELGKHQLSVEVHREIVDREDLLNLVEVSREVLECLVGVVAGVPLHLEDVPNPEVARCRVCGGELRDRLVRCLSCDTPHHEECWRFNRRCSTYGCGDTRARSVEPTKEPA